MPHGKQPAAWIDRTAAAKLGSAAARKSNTVSRSAKPKHLVSRQFFARESIVHFALMERESTCRPAISTGDQLKTKPLMQFSRIIPSSTLMPLRTVRPARIAAAMREATLSTESAV
jgi:hypothetical protein